LWGDGPLSFPSGTELLHAGIENCHLADGEGALEEEDAGCERRGGSKGSFLCLRVAYAVVRLLVCRLLKNNHRKARVLKNMVRARV
jgi:hypothetical protein